LKKNQTIEFSEFGIISILSQIIFEGKHKSSAGLKLVKIMNREKYGGVNKTVIEQGQQFDFRQGESVTIQAHAEFFIRTDSEITFEYGILLTRANPDGSGTSGELIEPQKSYIYEKDTVLTISDLAILNFSTDATLQFIGKDPTLSLTINQADHRNDFGLTV
jgi:hypothetical protein